MDRESWQGDETMKRRLKRIAQGETLRVTSKRGSVGPSGADQQRAGEPRAMRMRFFLSGVGSVVDLCGFDGEVQSAITWDSRNDAQNLAEDSAQVGADLWRATEFVAGKSGGSA